MALAHLGHAIDYPQLLKLLKIKPYGAPAGNIRLLEDLGLTVVYSKTDLVGLEAMLQEGHPVIVFVRTGELPYWTYSTDHALLIVGYDKGYYTSMTPIAPRHPLLCPVATLNWPGWSATTTMRSSFPRLLPFQF
jgi:hypothetical protein